MAENKYLNEEKYQNTKKKILLIALIVLVVGLLIGGSLIATGISKKINVNSKYSDENKAKITEQMATEKQNLLKSKTELENKIKPVEDEIKSLERVKFDGFNDEYYAREDKIEELNKSISDEKNSISVIDDALDESFNHCEFDEAKNNSYTSKYCSLKLQLNEFTDFNKDFDSFDSIPFYMFGAVVIIASCIISFSIFTFAKRREIMAFSAQQVMPVGKEIVDDITPTIGNAAGEIAKNISKGIKEGTKDNND